MKFETEFGLGEICGYNEDARRGDSKKMDDLLVKVVSITFDIDGQINYMVEHIGSMYGMQRFGAAAGLLNGDPAYNQEAGAYPTEDED